MGQGGQIAAGVSPNSIGARMDEYRAQAYNRMLSPERADPFAAETPAAEVRTYKDVMMEQSLDKEKADILRKVREQQSHGDVAMGDANGGEKKKRRWDAEPE